MITVCPTCGHKTRVKLEPPRVFIRGREYQVRKRTVLQKRLIPDGDSTLYCPPIPLVIVRKS